jgi:hypothetical protein
MWQATVYGPSLISVASAQSVAAMPYALDTSGCLKMTLPLGP